MNQLDKISLVSNLAVLHSKEGINLVLDAMNAIHYLWEDNEKLIKTCRKTEIANLKLSQENKDLKAEIESTRKALLY